MHITYVTLTRKRIDCDLVVNYTITSNSPDEFDASCTREVVCVVQPSLENLYGCSQRLRSENTHAQ